MIYQEFQNNFQEDFVPESNSVAYLIDENIEDLKIFLSEFGARSFNNGIYRTVSGWNFVLLRSFIIQAFERNDLIPFGFDWLGRIFCLKNSTSRDKIENIVMVEAGTTEVLEIPANIRSFHNNEIVEYHDAALATNFFQKWLDGGGARPLYSQCVAYKKPLYLGGEDEISNLVISDIDVYLEISRQVISFIKGK